MNSAIHISVISTIIWHGSMVAILIVWIVVEGFNVLVHLLQQLLHLLKKVKIRHQRVYKHKQDLHGDQKLVIKDDQQAEWLHKWESLKGDTHHVVTLERLALFCKHTGLPLIFALLVEDELFVHWAVEDEGPNKPDAKKELEGHEEYGCIVGHQVKENVRGLRSIVREWWRR